MLNEASDEQQAIIDAIKDNNVKVNSVAGSGKTTTVLHIAKQYKDESILLLTYNARLKMETRKKKDTFGLRNLEVHSYHSFCVSNYDNRCYKDAAIINLLKDNKKPLKKFNYSIIVVDEAQDMNKIYYKLVNKIINDNLGKCRMCIIGDKYQSIYQFNGADSRFITLSENIFKPNDLGWKELKLSISFRITNQMANFLNKCVMKFDYIHANKEGNKVRYIMTDTFNFERPVFEVLHYLNDCSYDDIFILAPSVKKGKNDSPVRVLANKLTDFGIPIYVPTDDDEKLDEEIIKNKIVFSTFHQVKGLERKNVIVYGFDESYFQLFNKNADINFCPNEIYVALTRGIENLTVFHSTQKNYLPFLDEDELEGTVYYEISKLHTVYDSGKSITLDVSEVTKHMQSDIINNATEYFEKVLIKEKEKFINIPIKTTQGKLVESVSEINGTIIPAYFEFVNNKKMSIYEILIDKGQEVKMKLSLDMPTSDLLKLSTQYVSFTSGYKYKMNQIVSYNWMDDELFDEAVDRLELVINKNAKFEVEIYNPEPKVGKVIVGRVDCIDNDTIWEFKCTRDLDSEHFIQLAIYALLNENMKDTIVNSLKRKYKDALENINKKSDTEYVLVSKLELGNILLINNGRYKIYAMDYENIKVIDDNKQKKKFKIESRLYQRLTEKVDIKEIERLRDQVTDLENKKYKYKLMNILSNEIYEIKFEKEKLEEMINYLLFHKYKNIKPLTDGEFIEDIFNAEIKLETVFDNKAFILNNVNSNAFIED
jgi:hypothetical protein